MNGLLKLIENANKRPLIIGIDGMCAAGKTTLAQTLSEKLSAPVIHTDDFFIPRAARTGHERINIDEARFIKEVLLPLQQGRTVCYGVFDCKKQLTVKQTEILKSDIYIIEGTYCCHPCLPDVLDIKVFCEISAEEQRLRLCRRESAEGLKMFENMWIPLENKYFNNYNIRERCDVIL